MLQEYKNCYRRTKKGQKHKKCCKNIKNICREAKNVVTTNTDSKTVTNSI